MQGRFFICTYKNYNGNWRFRTAFFTRLSWLIIFFKKMIETELSHLSSFMTEVKHLPSSFFVTKDGFDIPHLSCEPVKTTWTQWLKYSTGPRKVVGLIPVEHVDFSLSYACKTLKISSFSWGGLMFSLQASLLGGGWGWGGKRRWEQVPSSIFNVHFKVSAAMLGG